MSIDENGLPHPPRASVLPWRRAPRRLGPEGSKGWPGPAPSLLDLGHLRPIFQRGVVEAYLGWALGSQGRDFVVWAGTVPHVVLVRPQSVEAVLRGGEDFLRNVEPSKALFGAGLLRMEGKPWQRRRVLEAGAFHPGQLQQARALIVEEAERLIALWRTRAEVFSPTRDLSSCMLRILGRFLFGFEFDLERHGGRALNRALVTLSVDVIQRHFLPLLLVDAWTGRRVAQALAWVERLCRELLTQGGDTPLLRALRGARDRGELSEQVVLDELRNFLIAGHETSATALSWVLALLAQHPEAAERVRAEVASQGLERLEYTTCLVKEALRLYPPAPFSVSVAMREVVLGDLLVPGGTRVDICSYVLHRLPELWPEPERFRPERFLDFDDRSTGAYLPFLLGPHRCVGAGLAMLELPLVTALVAQAFDFELPEGPPRPNLRVSLHPADFRLRVRPRQH
jgi:enediyne biosynthesis protein E7